MALPFSSQSSGDSLQVKLGNVTVWETNSSQTFSTYQDISVDLSAYANGQTYLLVILGNTTEEEGSIDTGGDTGGGQTQVTNFFIDNVSIEACATAE